MTREEILREALESVSGQREQDYGTPEDNFGRIAALWSAYLGSQITPAQVAVMMVLLKVGRVKSGPNGGTADCYVDMAGYAACAGEIATAKKKVGRWIHNPDIKYYIRRDIKPEEEDE